MKIYDKLYSILKKNNIIPLQFLNIAYAQKEKMVDFLLEQNLIPKETLMTLLEEVHGRSFKSVHDIVPLFDDATKNNFHIGTLIKNTAIEDLLSHKTVAFFEECRQCRTVPFQEEGNTLYAICADLDHLPAKPIIPYQGDPCEIDHYFVKRSQALYKNCFALLPTIQAVNFLMERAFVDEASDIHIYPQKYYACLQLRCHGKMSSPQIMDLSFFQSLILRLKILSKLDVTATTPQSGHFELAIAGSTIDFRTSFHPTVWGISCVIRLLNPKMYEKPLEQLGFSQKQTDFLNALAQEGRGLFLISGATGSGKTTTLYSLIQKMNVSLRAIMTLEDPVEYHLPYVRQSSVAFFNEYLKSAMRQDPDVILIGEIRDPETAKLAVRASLTGHLVLATVHAVDVYHIASRMIDLGVDPALLSSQLLGLMSQELSFCKNTKKRSAQATILPVTDVIKTHIRTNNTASLKSVLNENDVIL